MNPVALPILGQQNAAPLFEIDEDGLGDDVMVGFEEIAGQVESIPSDEAAGIGGADTERRRRRSCSKKEREEKGKPRPRQMMTTGSPKTRVNWLMGSIPSTVMLGGTLPSSRYGSLRTRPCLGSYNSSSKNLSIGVLS